MSEQVDISTMSKEELNAALLKDLNTLDRKVEQSDVEPETPIVKPEAAKAAADGQAQANAGDDAAEAAQADDDKDPYAKRVKNLVRRRHALEEEVHAKDAVLSAKDAEIAALKAKLDGTTDDTGDTKEPDVRSVVREEIEHKEKLSRLEKMDADELSELFEKNPNAKSRKTEIEALAKENPKLSFEAIDKILAPADYVDPIELNRKNAKKLSGYGRSRADLAQNFNAKTAPLNDLRAALTAAVNAGDITV